MASTQFPPALVRAIVAAMRRLAKSERTPRIHLLRSLSPAWASAIDGDAIRRSIAIRTPPMDVYFVRYVLQMMPTERRRRALVSILIPEGEEEFAAARQALANALHVCIKIRPSRTRFESFGCLMAALSANTRCLDISNNAHIWWNSNCVARIVRLSNLRSLRMRGIRIEDVGKFTASLAGAARLRWIDLRLTDVKDFTCVIAIVRSLLSLRRFDLRRNLPLERRLELRDILRAELGSLAEKVVF